MKKYRLKLNEITFIDLTEKQFNDAEDVNCVFENSILKGKQLNLCVQHLKAGVVVISPVDNFEVIDDEIKNCM